MVAPTYKGAATNLWAAISCDSVAKLYQVSCAPTVHRDWLEGAYDTVRAEFWRQTFGISGAPHTLIMAR